MGIAVGGVKDGSLRRETTAKNEYFMKVIQDLI